MFTFFRCLLFILGNTSSITPFLNLALTSVMSISAGRVTVR